MNESQLPILLAETWRDLRSPDVLWQLGTLALCMGLAWWLERHMQAHFAVGTDTEVGMVRLGRRGLKRVLFPLASLILLVAARAVLAKYHSVNLLNLAVPLLVSLALIRLVVFLVRQAIGASSWLASLERVFATLVWGVVALHILGWLPEAVDGLRAVSFNFGSQRLSLWTVLQGTAMVLLALLLALWIARAIERKLVATTGLDESVRLVMLRVAKAGLILVAVLIALPIVGIDLTTLSVFGGALGVGLGFGLQKIAANYVSGFIILLDRSIRIGNMITVGADRGVVKQITTRYTVIRAPNGMESLVPNETLVGSVVQNETYSDTSMAVPLNFQVSYGSELERVLTILVEIASTHEQVVADPPPKAFVVAFADSGINLRLIFWVPDSREGTLGVSSDINLAVWQRFRAEGIEIPFPQREVRLLPPLPEAVVPAMGSPVQAGVAQEALVSP